MLGKIEGRRRRGPQRMKAGEGKDYASLHASGLTPDSRDAIGLQSWEPQTQEV